MRNSKLDVFLRDRQGIFKWAFLVILLILAVLSSFYGYFRYVNQVEMDLSKRVNVLFEKSKGHFEKFKNADTAKKIAKAKEDLAATSLEFRNIYLEMPNRNNAIRAGMHHAFFEWHMENKEVAKDFLLKIYKKTKKSFFSPTVLYSLAILFTEFEDFDQSLIFLDKFIERYPKNFLFGEVLITKARILSKKERFQESYDVYQKMLKDDDLSLYSPIVDIELSNFEVLGFNAALGNDAKDDEKLKSKNLLKDSDNNKKK